MKYLPIFALLFATACIVVVALLLKAGNAAPRYKSELLMTNNETEFFWRLHRALPEFYIFTQVALSALISPNMDRKSKGWWPAFRRISQKRADYVLCAKQKDGSALAVVCVVELDDRSHNQANDATRDRYLMSAGIRTVRWESKKKPSESEIHQTIMSIYGNKVAT